MDEKPKVVFPNPWEPGPGNGHVRGNRELTPEWAEKECNQAQYFV